MQISLRKQRSFLCRLAILAVALLVASSVSAQLPGAGIFALQSMLSDKSPEIRMKAAEGLARVGGRRAVMILRRGLSDSRMEVRIAVVEALGYVGGRLALTVLSEALKDKAPEVRKRAVEALKDAGTISAIPIIQKAFGDKNAGVRLHAALMLRKIGNRRGVPVLGQVVLSDTDPAVRSAAATYLGSIGVKDFRAVSYLAQVVEGDSSPAVRVRAVESLGFLQLPQAIPVLRQALADKNAGVRLRATEVMGRVLSKDFE
jgi:HEAT repeat protein